MRDQLVSALAEFSAFYEAQGRTRMRESNERRLVVQWLASLDAVQRAAVCSTTDAPFVRILIEMIAVNKKSKARVEQFHVLRSSRGKNPLTPTFSRRPNRRTQDGDELQLPFSYRFQSFASEVVQETRIFNGIKSCDTISPSVKLVENLDKFIEMMDALTYNNFLRVEPSEAVLKGLPWTEQNWLKKQGYYALATYLAHQFELNIWLCFKTREIPMAGFQAKRHLTSQWLSESSTIKASVLSKIKRETTMFLKDFHRGGNSWSLLKTSLSLLCEVMQPTIFKSQRTAEDIFSCSLIEAGSKPQFSLMKMLWCEQLQTECSALLQASLVCEPKALTSTSMNSKQRRRKQQKSKVKEKKRDKEVHGRALAPVLVEMRHKFKLQHKIETTVKQVLDDLVDTVVNANIVLPAKKKRTKKKKKKIVASEDERMAGFLLLHFDQTPMTPPHRRDSNPVFDPLLDITTFLTPQKAQKSSKTTMRYQRYFFDDDERGTPEHSGYNSFASQFSLQSPPTRKPRPQDSSPFFFPPILSEEKVPSDPDSTSPAWYLPSSVLSQSSGSRGEEWNAFTWKQDEDFYPKEGTWTEKPSRCCHDPKPDGSSESDTKKDNDQLKQLQRKCDEYAQNVNHLESEMAALKITVSELQTALFQVQTELTQWKDSSKKTKAVKPVATVVEEDESSQLVATPNPHLAPFVSVPISLLPPRSKLHWDICEFVSQLQAETQHRLAAHTAVSRFCVSAVQALWPRAQVRPYGSFVTGLSLPSSDLDLVICLPKVRRDEPAEAPGVLEGRNAIKETWQQHLARRLRTESWVVPESVKTIPNASIPIITLLTTSPYNVRLDISFEGPGHNGLATNDLVHSLVHELPALTPLMLVLKTFIIERGLGVAYTGGLSSYALLLLVTRFLQEFHPPGGYDATVATQCNASVSSQCRSDFGTMLLGFMDFYGTKFDPRQTGISVATRSFLDREHLHNASMSATGWHNVQMEHVQFENMNLSSPGSRRQHLHRDNWSHLPPYDYDPHKFDPVYIEDPLRPANNVGRNCFRIMQIRRALATAFSTLSEPHLNHLQPHPYVGGVVLHPNNILRGILSCTPEPKWKGLIYPLESPPPPSPVPSPIMSAPILTSPVRHVARERHVTSATKNKEKERPKRRHSACVNDLLTKPILDDVAIIYSSLSPSRSLSFADVVIGKASDNRSEGTITNDEEPGQIEDNELSPE
ncbi:hypothetical protein THRCLA_10051 [Thraustotheca clavata]|uniref:Polymerase nucleotidyl transferase domain-containing protein n=1 Tax=Thraustotheca clavata TaxID=74557 RepID=A0A1V9YTG9_9STRA|nr:hypothetical protein THRCLA_10051 [Thraustotheca clavata]